jgi:hypothetical protein
VVPAAQAFDWRRALDREFYVISEVSVAFFILDIMEDYTAHRHFELDQMWTTMALLGALLFAVMWTRKKLRPRPR